MGMPYPRLFNISCRNTSLATGIEEKNPCMPCSPCITSCSAGMYAGITWEQYSINAIVISMGCASQNALPPPPVKSWWIAE
jgi:hypothetical protein